MIIIEILLTIAIGLLSIMIRNQFKISNRQSRIEQRLKTIEKVVYKDYINREKDKKER